MKPSIVALALCCLGLCAHAGEPATRTQPLKAVKSSIEMPEDWNFREEEEDGNFIYKITPEKLESDADTYRTGLMITVYTKLSERAETKPSEYAETIVDMAHENNDGSEVKIERTTEGPFKVFRADYAMPGADGKVAVTALCLANDATGTLYFLYWQNPAADSAQIAATRDKILPSLKPDASF